MFFSVLRRVSDLAASTRFYQDGLDLTIHKIEGERAVQFGFGNGTIFEIAVGGATETPVDHWMKAPDLPFFEVDDVDVVADRLARLGGSVVTAPYSRHSRRFAFIADPDGHAFGIGAYISEPST